LCCPLAAPSVSDLAFEPGTIEDFMIQVLFAPSAVSALSMLRDHYNGVLLLDVLFDLQTKIMLEHFENNPLLSLNTTYVYEDVDAEAEAQREFCKCQDPPKSNVAMTSADKFHALATPPNGDRKQSWQVALPGADDSPSVPRIGQRLQPAVLRVKQVKHTAHVDGGRGRA
jgi:hypothetical protein